MGRSSWHILTSVAAFAFFVSASWGQESILVVKPQETSTPTYSPMGIGSPVYMLRVEHAITCNVTANPTCKSAAMVEVPTASGLAQKIAPIQEQLQESQALALQLKSNVRNLSDANDALTKRLTSLEEEVEKLRAHSSATTTSKMPGGHRFVLSATSKRHKAATNHKQHTLEILVRAASTISPI